MFCPISIPAAFIVTIIAIIFGLNFRKLFVEHYSKYGDKKSPKLS
jgi:hypothetical protein